MFWIKILREIIDVFKEGASPHQVAGAFVLGFFIGLTPGWPLHIILLVLITLLLNVNLGIASVAATIAVALAWLLDPLIDSVGYFILKDLGILTGLWTSFYNNPLIMLSRFNNTLVMGAGVTALILSPIFYFIIYKFVSQYREQILNAIKNWRVSRMISGSRLFALLQQVRRVSV